MNRFDKRYEIRMASYQDEDTIMHFIKSHWSNNHILATNRDFFEYEFRNREQLNFIIAVDLPTGQLAAILGYYRASDTQDYLDIWGAMWKVEDSLNPLPFLGIELMKRLISNTGCRAQLGIGANLSTSIPLLKLMLNYHIYKLDQYYRISRQDKFWIAKINKKMEVKPSNISQSSLRILGDISELTKVYDLEKNKERIPYKDSWYINRRYFNHPIYQYTVFGVEKQAFVVALMVTRPVSQNGRQALRIIDYIGDPSAFGGLYDSFSAMLAGYEYIDCYCYGMEENVMNAAGFLKKGDDDPNIIPNYFEPFEQKNIEIWANSNVSGCTFFKGDGDQDRPNRI